MSTETDISAYLARIHYLGPRDPTLAVLRNLIAHHLAEIAFEGLDPFLGLGVDIAPAVIHTKLVHARRGGYCQEHNSLFHDILAALGFTVRPLGGRVIWMNPGRIAPLTHRLTLVDLAEGQFIADVGFGGQSPTAPLRLEPGFEQATSHGTYRLTRDHPIYEIQMKVGDRWEPMYRFTLEPQTQTDFEVANWFTSTHPRGRFTRNLVAARVVGDTRVTLFNTALAVRHPDGQAEQRTLANAAELRNVLEEVMGLALPVSVEVIWSKLPTQPVPSWP
jgi:N-hydroxyarylamine O-acetyltransferase